MMQVAGRAGRRNDRGRVIIQTSQPKHPVIQQIASGDYHAMALTELSERKNFGYPPYSRLIRLLLRHEEYEKLRHASHQMAILLRKKFGSRVMGPVSPALEMLRGEHRAEMLIKIELGSSMKRARTMLREVVDGCNADAQFKGVKIDIDVDAW
jgi:primosomal protein N' (replication factor Y)